MNDEAFEAVLIVLDALAAIGTPAFVGGSLASAIFGTPCSAIDADLVALMRTGHADRQWLDILGVFKVMRKDLDYEYLEKWAARLELPDLLKRARQDAG